MLNTIPGDISRAQLGWRKQVRLWEALKIFANPSWRGSTELCPLKINQRTLYNKHYCTFNNFGFSVLDLRQLKQLFNTLPQGSMRTQRHCELVSSVFFCSILFIDIYSASIMGIGVLSNYSLFIIIHTWYLFVEPSKYLKKTERVINSMCT